MYKTGMTGRAQTVQDSIPVSAVHEKYNLIETDEGTFTKSYKLTNLNYHTASEDEQTVILSKWRSYLNGLGSNMEMSLTIYNRPMDIRSFREEHFIKEAGDGFDHLRSQLNAVLERRAVDGRNSIDRDEYITYAVHTTDVKKAAEVYKRLDGDTDKQLKTMGSAATPIPIEEKLEILHDIYNMDNRGEFLTKTKILNAQGHIEEVVSFDFDNIRSMGISVNDCIAPSSIQYLPKMIRIGRKYARALKVTDYPSILPDVFLCDLTGMSFYMLTTLNVRQMSNAETEKLINQQLAYIREEKNNSMRANRREQVPEEMINPSVNEREEEILNIRREVRENDEHLFETTLTTVIFADTEEELDEYTETVISECKKKTVRCEVLTDQQEEGFVATLPLCVNPLRVKRTLKSSSCAIIEPFSNLEINEKDGINYSMNAVSKNLLIYNRLNKPNYNGFILGSSGSGKSFTAKTEIVNVFLRQDSDILILDPEQEYVYITKALGGQVVSIMPGGENHINPLDIVSLDYEYDSSSQSMGEVVDPILEKVSFINKLFESMLSENWGMDSIQKSLIDECLRDLYAPFMKDGKLARAPKSEETPTFNDMMEWFSKRSEPEARTLYYVLRRYAGEGTLNIFSQRTNVEIKNRIVCFDISAVGDELKLMAMNVIQDMCWARLVENRRIGKYTFFYVDELHIFFQPGSESAAEFLTQLWKRARKHGGVPTGITQSPADLLEHPIGKRLLSECNFIQILNQSSDENRERLRAILNLSESSLSYITNAPIGQGLFYTGMYTVPFFSRFPEDNDIFPMLTSDMKQLREIEERKRHERSKELLDEKRLSYDT